MKRNVKILLIAVLLIFVAAAIVYAATATNNEPAGENQVSAESILKSSEILNLLGSNSDNLKTKVVYDDLQNKTIYRMENEKYFIDIGTNNELTGIHAKSISTNLSSSSFEKEQARQYIQEKYETLNLPADYKLDFIEKYDDLIWQANFEKNYDGIHNKYESVKVYFIPDSDEVLALGAFYESPTTSNINISEDEAISSAAEKLNINTDEIISAELSMEKSNDFYNKENKDTSIYPVWVVQANNNSIVYISAQTNEVIGGDAINE